MKKSVKILSLILISVLIISSLCTAVFAEDTQCGPNATYVYNQSTETLTISGNGAITSTPWNVEGSSIDTVIIESGITSIPEAAFSLCEVLSCINIPDSVTEIGKDVFYSTSSYQQVAGQNPGDDFELKLVSTYYVTIKASTSSYAKTYAEAYGIPFTSTDGWQGEGDLNGDNVVDNLDLICLKKYALGLYTNVKLVNADVNGDGYFSVLDIIRLKKYLANPEEVNLGL